MNLTAMSVKPIDDLRRDNGTEPSSLDDDPPIGFTAHTGNLTPDMLSFTITICPDHEDVGVSSFRREIAFDLFHWLEMSVAGQEDVRYRRKC